MVSDMKLNNKGWGMITFIIIIGLLFLVILLIAALANEYDDGLPSSRRRSNYITTK
jgi:hypothetical protein